MKTADTKFLRRISGISENERVKFMFHYKRPAFWLLAAAVLICITAAAYFLNHSAPNTEISSPPALEDTRKNYSAKQAAKDGCVVLDENSVVSGEDIWYDFVNEAKEGNSASVRIYQTYSSPYSYYVKELSYNGEKYLLQYYDRTGDTDKEFLFQGEYKYLVSSPYPWMDKDSIVFLLADSEDVTAMGYFSAMASSTVRPEYDVYNHCRMIYNVLVDDNEYFTNTFYGVTFADIDGDGKEEKCCLGMGMTSGVSTFTFSAYKNGKLKYNNIYIPVAHFEPSFVKDEEGKLQVRCVSQGEEPEIHLFDIVITKGNVELMENGETLASATNNRNRE